MKIPYHIAFDRDKNLEFILYKSTAFMKDMFCTTNYPLSIEDNKGLDFLYYLIPILYIFPGIYNLT